MASAFFHQNCSDHDLKTLLLPWAMRFCPRRADQQALIERVIAIACHDEKMIISSDVEAELFSIMQSLALHTFQGDALRWDGGQGQPTRPESQR